MVVGSSMDSDRSSQVATEAQLKPGNPLIQLDRLGLRLGQRSDRKGKILSPGTPIFSEVSLEIRSGDRLGVVGQVGSGKTSLLRLLNRLIEPTQGQLYYQGQPYDRIPIAQLRRQILYVAQEPKLLQPTGLAAIVYALELHHVEIKPRLEAWVSRMELSEALLNKPQVELSQGQRQWISLTRALALETPVLLLDEPTAALDPHQKEHLRQILQDSPNITAIVASQEIDWLRSIGAQGRLIRDRSLSPSMGWSAIHEQLRELKPSLDEDWS
jgi:D-methionine transport system ATP-binding protein